MRPLPIVQGSVTRELTLGRWAQVGGAKLPPRGCCVNRPRSSESPPPSHEWPTSPERGDVSPGRKICERSAGAASPASAGSGKGLKKFVRFRLLLGKPRLLPHDFPVLAACYLRAPLCLPGAQVSVRVGSVGVCVCRGRGLLCWWPPDRRGAAGVCSVSPTLRGHPHSHHPPH